MFYFAEIPKIRIIGRRTGLDNDILRLIDDAMALTKDNTTLHLTIAFNYGARDEIARAASRIAEAVAEGTLESGDITSDVFGSYLDTADLPDPDLLIRTAGEQRLSNFLLWQMSYAEIHTRDVCWPDFGKKELEAAFRDYGSRVRKFGKVL